MQAREFFGAERHGSPDEAEVIGFYSNGCVAGAEALPETGPTWQAMRLSRNRNWGHPELIDYVTSLSRQVAETTSWNGLYVGDMSQPRGGPMLTGHESHQSGLDADIWMLPARDLTLGTAERESLSSISVRAQRGAWVSDNWTPDHAQVLRLAARDPRVERIFVTTGVKVWLCRNETGDRSYLNRIRPAGGHHYHFHVRLACPAGSRGCEPQEPPPPGDGCDEAEARAAAILNPPPPRPGDIPARPAPPGPPRGNGVTMSEVPRQCLALLSGFP
ncbi:penicillin-insensitive murein endopeptidase [Roseibacterium sp. SDUM158017]|nr:penicillin-insensitive murein endopeptidase [Roseibacterium sp. SDUM158017]MDG4647082.1 penicillin-insensitive murein endopeptidase [Roseibacterium sp. SDUM158017]